MALYQFPPLCSSAAGILLRVSCIFVADGAETELRLRVALSGSCYAETGKSRGFARSGPLVGRVRGLWLLPVWPSRLGEALAKTEDLSKPEWCFLPVVGSLMVALLLAVTLPIRIGVQQTGINGVFLLSFQNNRENLSIFRVALSSILPEGASGRRERNCSISEKQRHDFLVFSLHGFRQRRATPAIMIPPVIHFPSDCHYSYQ